MRSVSGIASAEAFGTATVEAIDSPPVLVSLDYNQTDTLGGDVITIKGTDLGSASLCEVGTGGVWTSATIGVNTSDRLSFTMPAKAAGTYQVRVTGPGGLSNTLNIDAWAPSDEAGCTVFAEQPNYAGGTWVKRVGALDITTAAGTVPASGGAPSFPGDGSYLTTTTLSSSLIANAGSTVACVGKPTNLNNPEDAATPYSMGKVFFSKSSSGPIGMMPSGDGTNEWLSFFGYDDGAGVYKTISSVRGAGILNRSHAMVGAYQSAVSMQFSVNGSPFAACKRTLLGDLNYDVAPSAFYLGASYSAVAQFTGLLHAFATFNTTKDDTFSAKWTKWAGARFGLLDLIECLDNVGDPAGGDTITVSGPGLGGATATFDGSPISPSVTDSNTFKFVMPAKAAGTYTLAVTLANGSVKNFSIESWSPTVESVQALYQGPNYNAGTNTFTATVGSNVSGVAGPPYPAAVGGCPDFERSTDFTLQNAGFTMDTWANGDGAKTLFAVFDAESITTTSPDATVYANETLIGDTGQNVGLILRKVGASTYQAIMYEWDNIGSVSRVAVADVTSFVNGSGGGRLIVQGKKVANVLYVRAVGAAGIGVWVSGGTTAGSGGGTNGIAIGGIASNVPDGIMRAVGAKAAAWSDAAATKFEKWARNHHP